MKKIYINGNLFDIPDTTDMKGASGEVYRLVTKDEDLAVKIYHESVDYQYIDSWYPDEDELDCFTLAYTPNLPVLLSKHKVLDENKKYIGCATDYVTETRGNSYNAIKRLPIDLFFRYMNDIENSIPYFDERFISLCDWQLGNLKLGITKSNADEKIYIFDDSEYSLVYDTNDAFEMNNLIEDITSRYSNEFGVTAKNAFMKHLLNSGDYLRYFEKVTRGYNNIEEFFTDYAKVYQKKSS